MGYSCTEKARLTLEQIEKRFGGKELSNALVINGVHGFYEIGKEREDGAIEGTWYVTREDFKEILRQETFLIAAGGRIGRFSVMTFNDCWECYQAAMQEYQRIHGIAFMEI